MNRLRLLAVLAVLAGAGAATAQDDEQPAGVRIGMVSSLFRDTPEPLVRAMMQPFGALMESQTGLAGTLVPAGDAAHLGALLADDKVQIGVFHGIEFGWARQRHPELRPLMIAVNQQRHLEAFVLVRAGRAPERFADLKGKAVALPQHSREHCHIFLQRRCQELGLPINEYFGTVTTPPTVEDALDDVVDGVVQAALVDGVSLECYQRRKPGRYARLKVLERSEVFPAAVVAYHPGSVDEATLRRFREGLINANKGALGRQFLTLWKLTGFEPVPADYEKTLTEILKAYPHPLAAAVAK
jgi:ABC-type phosphate/phosphonate transport system substrate-binding protein